MRSRESRLSTASGASLWWVFQLPSGVLSHVPAETETEARKVLRRHSYDKAPVDSWPCIGTKEATREGVHEAMLMLFYRRGP